MPRKNTTSKLRSFSRFTPKDVVEQFVYECLRYNEQTETGGENRSPLIDTINKWIGAAIGSPYCISSLCYVLNKISEKMGVRFDLPITSGTQNFWIRTKVEYKDSTPAYGMVFILQSKKDTTRGHAGIVLSSADAKGNFATFEFNTTKGSKQGCFHKIRNVSGDNDFRTMGFVDIKKALNLNANIPFFRLQYESSLLSSTPQNPNWDEIASNIKLDVEIVKIEYLQRICEKIIKYKTRFTLVENVTKIPWQLVAAIFFMEASLDFNRNFLNGQPLNQKTTIVPIGHGPWKNWEDSAVEGLSGWKDLPNGYWTLGNQLKFAEQYNGLGYRKKGLYSSYVTSFTNYSIERGKYVRDHVFDSNAIVTRPGVAAILLMLKSYL